MPKSATVAAEKRSEPAPRAAGKVIVASKIPHDIVIQICQPRSGDVAGQYGTVKETIWQAAGDRYLIRGTKRPINPPKGYPAAPDMELGYALTPNIPADFWEKWLEQNAKTDMVVNGLIFAHSDRASIVDEAKDFRDVRSGLDPLDMSEGGKDPRLPKPITTQVGKIETMVRG